MIFNRVCGCGWWLVLTFFLGASAGLANAQSSNIVLFGFTNTWKYNQTTSYDGTNRTSRAYDDSTLPAGRGVLAFEDAGNSFVTSSTNTVLALGRNTYYFRTHFNFSGNLARLMNVGVAA
jgi:hypothetical protein